MSDRDHPVARATVLVLVGFLVAVALALLAGSLNSYEAVKERLDSFASDGDAELTREAFDGIVIRLRIAAGAVVLAAAGAFATRSRLAGLLATVAAAAGGSLGELRRSLRSAIEAESRLHLAALVVVTAVGAAARLEFLFQPMRYDEAVTYVHYASQPLYISLTTYTAPNNHVFHSVLAHVSTGIFGGAPWALRMPALVAGVLLVPAVYLMTRRLYGRDPALLAAGLTAGSSVLIEYSTNARGYTILALAFALLFTLASRLASSGNPAEWLAFALLGAVGFFTVPVMLYAFAGVVAWLALELLAGGRRDLLARRLAPAAIAAFVLTGILYLPIAAASGIDSLVANEFVQPLSWDEFLADLPDSGASVLRGWHRDIPLPFGVVLAFAFAAGVILHRRVGRVSIPPALGVVVGIAPILVLQHVVPFERVWLFLLPLYLSTAAAGVVLALRPLLAHSRRGALVAVALAVAVAGAMGTRAVATQSVARSEDTSTFRAGAEVADLLEARLETGDKVLVAPPADGILEYHLVRRDLDPAELLFWSVPGDTRRFLAVVKEAPANYSLDYLLEDERLEGAGFRPARLLRRYREAAVYELRRSG